MRMAGCEKWARRQRHQITMQNGCAVFVRLRPSKVVRMKVGMCFIVVQRAHFLSAWFRVNQAKSLPPELIPTDENGNAY